jgi:hypothetical protein
VGVPWFVPYLLSLPRNLSVVCLAGPPVGVADSIIAMNDYDGVFKGSPVNFTGAQSMVLTRLAGESKIRAILWSSYRR